jgi:hypothetical protein
MSDTAEKKLQFEVNWTEPQMPATRSGINWGLHEPRMPFEINTPESPPHGGLASELMSQVYGEFTRGDLTPWRWLTSPDLGDDASFSRPDLA